MVLIFDHHLPKALQEIHCTGEPLVFPVHELERPRQDEQIPLYGQVKWKIVDLLNEHYNSRISSPFDLYHWLNEEEHDEVAYFLNEAGSNSLCYSEFKIPSKFHLWLGQKGFVIGIEQKGKGFDAWQIHQDMAKENEGAAFDFFRRCQSSIFFDDCRNARIVFMRVVLD